MLGQSSIVGFVLWIEKKKDEIESGEERWRQLNIFDDRFRFVPLGFGGIRCCQDRRASIERADDTGLCDG